MNVNAHLELFSGKECTQVIGSVDTGSMVSFDFGELYSHNINNTTTIRGEHTVSTRFCQWRVTDAKNNIICTSNDLLESVNGQSVVLSSLVGCIVEKVYILNNSYDLEVVFRTGERISLFCNYVTQNFDGSEDEVPNYVLFFNKLWFVIESHNRVMKCVPSK